MLIKVCGLTQNTNLLAVDVLQPDMAGMIFYARSPRAVGATPLSATRARRVGVFVNEDVSTILHIARQHALDYIQLHGNEPLLDVIKLHRTGIPIIKAISVGSGIDQQLIHVLAPYCSYFLFDAQGRQPGGNGHKFDWNLLNDYNSPVPFLLSGGIGPQDAKTLLSIRHPAFAGIDLNSGFETSPGIKHIETLQHFIHDIRQQRA